MNPQTPQISPSKTLLFLIGWLFISSTILCQAQTKTDTLVAYQYFKKADSLLFYRHMDSSMMYYKKALPIYKKAGKWERVASYYNKVSKNQRIGKKLKESLGSANKALQICKTYLSQNNKEKARAYTNIGAYYYNKALYRTLTTSELMNKQHLISSLGFFEKALKIQQNIKPLDPIAISSSYSWIGNIYYKQREYRKTLTYFKKMAEIREQKLGDDNPKMASTYSSIAIVYDKLEKFDEALKYQHKGLELEIKHPHQSLRRITKNYRDLGGIYRKIGRLNIALDYYKRYLETVNCLYNDKEHEALIHPLMVIGITYKNKGEYDKALIYYNRATEIRNKASDNQKKISFYLYGNIGATYILKGEYDKALNYFKKSISLSVKIHGENYRTVASDYNGIANIHYEQKEYDLALLNYSKALKIREEIYNEGHSDLTESYNDLGKLLTTIQKYDEALTHYNNALNIRKDVFGNTHPLIADLYTSLGDLYYKKKEYSTALSHNQKALVMQQQLFGEQHPKIALSYNNLAKVYIAKKEYQTSLNYYEKAIAANRNQQKDNSHQSDISNYFNQNIVLSSLQGKAKVYNLLYTQDHNPDHLAKAVAIYEQADRIIDHIRETFTSYQDKVDFAQKAKDIYKAAIATQLQLHDLQNNQNALTQAFYYAEKSKANTLKELVNGNNAKKVAGLPNAITTLEKELRTDRAFYQSQITKAYAKQKRDTTKITRYENELFTITQRQDSLTRVIATQYPKYHELTYKKEIISLTEIQKQLDDRTTVVEFFTSDSITYAFTISKQHTAVQQLKTPNLSKQIEEFRNHIISKELQEYKTFGHSLYQQLLAPLRGQLVGDQLIIIPDGPLWHLNFETLLTQKATTNNPVKLPYLLKDYAISYANAANLLFTRYKHTSNKDQSKQECLAFSFSDSTQIANATNDNAMRLATLRDLGDDLPGTRKEIKAISNIIDGQYYYGSQAIEANFKKNAGAYNILHLALHGDVDHEHPQNSKLYFTKTKDTIEDNLLYAHELFAMDIPAELTVLSACNTGSGTIAKGEGIMSLGSAFQYAGTKSLLLSSWEVSDTTTPELMQYFYTHLKSGMNKARALQQAKLDYLETANIHRTQPVYWAGFYLVGDPAPIHFENNTVWYWLLGIGSVLVLVLIVFWYRRKHTSTVPVLSQSKGSA